MKDTERVLARKLARELTPEEIETVGGGGQGTLKGTYILNAPDINVDYEY
jgi:hypothetical protein